MYTKKRKSLVRGADPRTQNTRRRFLAGSAAVGAGLVIGAPFVIIPGRAKAAEKIVFVGWGGSTQEAQDRIFCQTFEEETGIEVVNASGPNMAKVKAMVQTGNVEWDVVTLTGAMAMSLGKQGMLENLDLSIIDTAVVNSGWIKDFAVGWYYYTGGIAYDPKRHPAGKHPRTWEQFWDAGGFPGKRGLRPRAEENLEMALMADGVQPKDLYPLDVERAFKAMDRIKPHVSVWIKATAQTITMLQSGEVDFDFTYSARVENAKAQGASLEFVYETPLSAPGLLGIPKGSKNKEAAMKLIAHFMREDRQLAWGTAKPGYSPQNRKALDRLAPEMKAKLPDPDNPAAAFIDIDWWGENYVEVSKRFKEWLLI